MDDRRGRWAALQKQFGTQQGGPTAAKVIEDMIALLRTSLAEDEGSKYIQEQFLEFLADKLELWKQYPRITSGSVDTLVDCLLLISNRNPSPLAAKATLVVTSMFTKDEKVMARFKATKVNLMKLCLPLYIQGGDALMRKQALDFAVLLLTSGVGIDVDDITTDPAIINKITWAERRMAWEHIRTEREALTKLVERVEQHESALSAVNRSAGRIDVSLDQLHSEIESFKTKTMAQEMSITELRRSAERQAETSATIRASLEALDEALHQTNKTMRAHEDNILLLNETSDQHDAATQQLAQGLRALEGGLRNADAGISSHTTMLKAMEGNFGSLETMLEQMRTLTSSHDASLQRSFAEIKSLQAGLADVRAVAESAETAIESVASANRELGAAIGGLKEAVEAVDGAVSSVQGNTEAQVSALKTSIKSQESALHQLRVEAGGSLTQLKTAVTALDESQHELRAAVDAQAGTIARVAETQRGLEELHGVARELQQAVMYVQETASGHAGDIEKLHSTTGAHQNMLRDLLSATEAASTQVDALQGSMESVQGTVEQLWQNFSATTTSLRELQGTNEAVRREIDRLQHAADDSTANVASLQESTRQIDSRLRETAQKADAGVQQAARRSMELAADVASLKHALDEYAALARRLSDATRDIDALIDSIRTPSSDGGAVASSAAPQRRATAPAPLAPQPTQQSQTQQASPVLQSMSSAATVAAAAPSSPTMAASAGLSRGLSSGEVVTRDAEQRLRMLSSMSSDASVKLEIIGWLARHAEWLAAGRLLEARDSFLQWVEQNSQLVKKAAGPQTDAVRFAVDSLRERKRRPVLLALLECLLKSDANVMAFHSLEGMDVLLPLLRQDDDETVVGVLRALRAAARNTHCILKLREHDGLNQLVRLLRSPQADLAEYAAAATRAATRLDDIIPDLLVAGGIEALAALLQSQRANTVEHAACALRNSARLDTSITAIQATGALSVMLSLLKTSSNEEVTKACAGALRACARNLKAQMELQQLGGLDYLGLRYPLVK